MPSQVKSLEELQEDVQALKEKINVLRKETGQLLMAGLTSMGNRIYHLEEFVDTISRLARTTATAIESLIALQIAAPSTAVSKNSKKSNEGIEVA